MAGRDAGQRGGTGRAARPTRAGVTGLRAGDAEEGGAEATGADGGAGAWPASVPALAQVFVGDLADPVLEPDDAHHLARVLRAEPGETVLAADGRGAWRPCRYQAGGSGRAAPVLVPDGDVVTCARPEPLLTVAFVPVKGDRPEWVVQKLTEVGVDRIVVLRSRRSVVRWDRDPSQAPRALGRLQRVAASAAAQSRRPWIPEVAGVLTLAELAATCGPGGLALAEPGGPPPGGGQHAVAVGPEGGWSDDERTGSGLPTVGLGPGVLRAETAAVAVGTLLCALRSGVVRPGAGGAA